MMEELLECLSHVENDSHTPCNTISSMVNVCIRYVIFWTKRGILSQCEISPVGFITCNAISLCWLQKGGKSLYDKLTPGVLISYCTMAHTLIWRVILLHSERTTARSSYLTLKIDSYTTWNMISSIVNVHICFTIILAKRQSSVNTTYSKKDIVGSPLIIWLCDNGCIWTYYLLSLLNLRKGSYSIISGNNSQSVYRTLQNESHTLTGGVILWCIETIPGILICRWKITPTHHALRPDRKGMCANLVLGVILWYFEMISGVFIWLRQNKLYGLIDSGYRHIFPCHFTDKNMRNLQRGSHFVMRHKHSRSQFVKSKNNSPNEYVGLKALLELSHYIII